MAKDTAVYLSKSKSGKDVYWKLLWRDGNGKNHCQSIGNVKKLSKRQAEKIRQTKLVDLTNHPGRRGVGRSPLLGDYLDHYLKMRKSELQPATLELHRQTGEYLKAYFGPGRRLNSIQRPDGRAFKAALADGDLAGAGRIEILSESSVHLHIRNARKMFGVALEDDTIPSNPFDKIAGKAPPAKGFHEVTENEFDKLMENAEPNWRLLLAICYHAGLRRGEAVNLRWNLIDWERSRLKVIANCEWRPKDRDCRTVPMVPELRAILLEAFEQADTGAEKVIPDGSIIGRDTHKPFTRLCNRAGVKVWSRPFQTLRKTRATIWARVYPQHVVSEWLGHAQITTTSQYYLQISDREYDHAAGLTESKKKVFAIKSAIKNAV